MTTGYERAVLRIMRHCELLGRPCLALDMILHTLPWLEGVSGSTDAKRACVVPLLHALIAHLGIATLQPRAPCVLIGLTNCALLGWCAPCAMVGSRGMEINT
jgi:hypothetical protein